MKAELSATMKSCVDFMGRHGGEIHRHPGGYWATPDFRQNSGLYYGTSTVQALVDRKVALYTEWKGTEERKFPVRAVLADERTRNGTAKP